MTARMRMIATTTMTTSVAVGFDLRNGLNPMLRPGCGSEA